MTVITATTRPASSPPSIALEVTAVPANTITVSITRDVAGLPTTAVRGAESQLTSGGTAVVVEYEAPFGVPATYRATTYDSAGVALDTVQVTALLDVDEMWISDPLSPTVSAACRGVKSPESFSSLTYTLASALTPTEGVELPVGLSGVRQAASGVPLTIIAEGSAEAAQIRTVLRYASPFLLRCPIRWQIPLPPLSYCLASQVTDNLFGGGTFGRSHLSLTFDLVQPPGRSIATAKRTYQSFLDEASTYGDLATLYATYTRALLGST